MKNFYISLLSFLVLTLNVNAQVTRLNNSTVSISSSGDINCNSLTAATGNSLNYRYTVGAPPSKFATVSAAVTWLKTNMTAPSELLLDGGTHVITDSIGIELPYVLSIRGLAFDVTKVSATTGLTGKPMFVIRSNVNFERIHFDGSALASYGTLDGEDFCQVTADSLYSEFKDCKISRFRKMVQGRPY